MQALIQRVTRAEVRIGGQVHGAIGAGLLILLCAEIGDGAEQADALLGKILKLRIFSDDAGKMNLSVQDVRGGLLIVSQFTLAADTRRGNRPSFTQAAPPALGRELYDYFVGAARRLHPEVATGAFGADMAVELINDGPVTIPLHIPAPTHGQD
ncbi:D-aminoacyl-tRNA deacylase [Kerstersia gyiorum]|jgi:D-tyrosyl-tRNA(Tyr) deacylase|uniref:D-aminoacyl-tRNA deacylase n=1 Tax=Kerstersia gyiorum TaxID=206506 RepID=A0A171KVJ0_9BURK|nr:D-aminoacyl-tRNA deacylase [Kerstersia gyiorum]AZV94552.1 D-tyrosyl-tRNA(Tyr) deacylase [Bordetella sp. J329]MCO7638385.1 D-aminoacyl-tRNA deacylase [Pseudomonas sp. S 311-6]KKO72907.1 D-tyrosyl-tRNA(Tyr) deacylase [Kerstersia gyiorum]MCH4272474.1 D-aminoacyl-tRNA deacylase [Kerstersia gyiorum]MCI1229064.1 D-aminoacyl-tRNA deacylase [Kerstersia gyiorum]